jgi:hypothetical protein
MVLSSESVLDIFEGNGVEAERLSFEVGTDFLSRNRRSRGGGGVNRETEGLPYSNTVQRGADRSVISP